MPPKKMIETSSTPPSPQPLQTVAASLRAVVQPNGAAPRPLSTLTNEQLVHVGQWIIEGQTNETIARQIQQLWGKCTKTPWNSLMESMSVLREALFFGQEPVSVDYGLDLDPLAESARLIRALQVEFAFWNERARDPEATEDALRRANRIAVTLETAIESHAKIKYKLELNAEETKKSGFERNREQVTNNTINILYSQLASEGMPDFLESALGKIRGLASRKATSRELREDEPMTIEAKKHLQ
ncbi:MAG: hypothetical protein WC654_00860 [Patescibacteria group bacterium]